MKKEDNKGITIKKEENLSDWYSEVVQKAELADYAPVSGFMIIRPNAYSIWEKIQEEFNKVIEKEGVKNAYFPLLIPEAFFKKEAEHAEGFSPELAYLEQKDEGKRLAIRPTSETIMYDSYSKWIRSWRDLPLKINQWCNIVRWEVKQTKPFLRTREFLWHEGHNVFASEEEADADMKKMINEYKSLVENLLAIPVILGQKSQKEKFPGAKTTMTIESLMPDGKAIQMGTSHNLGQNFAKAFNVKFKDKNEKQSYAWQTSWGFSTRLIGAIIMVHGDDKGFVLPPRVAKNKLVIIPILFDKTKSQTLKKADEINRKLSHFGSFVDDRTEVSAGWKYHEWELKGIPLRLEIGPKDMEKKEVVIVRRDTSEKMIVKEKDIVKKIPEILEDIQNNLFKKAKKYLNGNIDEASSMAELKKKIKEGKIVKIYMTDGKDKKGVFIEDYIKEECGGATSRIVVQAPGKKEGRCISTGQKTNTIAYFAKNY